MKKFIALTLIAGSLLGLAGCSATEKVGELAKKSYEVVNRTQEVLLVVEDEIAGSPLADRVGADIDAVQKALDSLEATLELVMDFSGVTYQAIEITSTDLVGDLDKAIAELDDLRNVE